MSVQRKYTQKLLPQQVKRIAQVLLIHFLAFQAELFSMENNGRGAKAVGMANAFVALADNLWAIDYNPAGLSHIHRIEAAAFIIPEQFGLTEFRTRALGIAVPCSFTTLACTIEEFGFDLFKETEWRAGTGIKLDQYVSVGISFNLHHLNVLHYGSSQYGTLDGGILTRIAEGISIGFNMQNITKTTLGSFAESLPQVCVLGVCWNPGNDLTLSMDLEKDIRYPLSIRAGCEQIIFHMLKLRAGAANNPDKYSAGIAVQYGSCEFAYAGYSHTDLGWTHQIELSFLLNDE